MAWPSSMSDVGRDSFAYARLADASMSSYLPSIRIKNLCMVTAVTSIQATQATTTAGCAGADLANPGKPSRPRDENGRILPINRAHVLICILPCEPSKNPANMQGLQCSSSRASGQPVHRHNHILSTNSTPSLQNSKALPKSKTHQPAVVCKAHSSWPRGGGAVLQAAEEIRAAAQGNRPAVHGAAADPHRPPDWRKRVDVAGRWAEEAFPFGNQRLPVSVKTTVPE